MTKCPIAFKSKDKWILDSHLYSLSQEFDITYVYPKDLDCYDECKNVFGLVAGTETLYAAELEKMPALQVIARTGSGVDNIDLNYTDGRKITVTTCPEVVAPAVAQFTIRHIMKLTYLPYNDYPTKLFKDISVGVVGMGAIGSKVYWGCHQLGFDVCGYDIGSDSRSCPRDLMSEVLKCDVITWHIPQKNQHIDNNGVIDSRILDRLKDDVVLLNFSRPGLFNPFDLTNFCYDRLGTNLKIYIDGKWNDERDGTLSADRNYASRHMGVIREYPHVAANIDSVRVDAIESSMRSIQSCWDQQIGILPEDVNK